MLAAQLHLFEPSRLPRRPYCTDDLRTGLRIRGVRRAMRERYIQVNPPSLRFWMVHDIDRPGAALAWENAGLEPPAWAALNVANGHAHLAWGIDTPVLTGNAAREAPVRYLCAIESAYRERLGADPAFGGLITKNPLHPDSRVLLGPQYLYSLDELAEAIPDLNKHRPKPGARATAIGLGRNCYIFDQLRVWAYQRIRAHRDERNYVLWENEVRDRANAFNGDLPRPLLRAEVYHIARSVSRFCWKNDRAAWLAFRDRQSWKGQRSGQARREATNEQRHTARVLAARGYTQTEIAADIGVTQQTVSNWLRPSTNEPKSDISALPDPMAGFRRPPPGRRIP